MKIDKKLNLAFPVQSKDGETWIYSTPIALETFKRYHMVIADAHAKIFGKGLKFAAMSGWRIAAMTIENIAIEDGTWEGQFGVQHGLMNEIVRLTNAFVPTPNGWSLIPLEDAINNKYLSEEDKDEVMNAICFFTLVSSMENQKMVQSFWGWISERWGGRLDASNCTEFQSSLPTLTATANTGVMAAGSSLPS